MSKYVIKNSIWFVLAESIRIYFSNIDKFFIYMLFPVFGQIIGIILTFALSLGFAPKIIERVESPSMALLFVLLLALPGLLIFMKAFWDYMVAYVALNSMTEGAITTGKVYDFQSHNEVATRRIWAYIWLLLIVGALSALASNILLIVPGFIIWIYFILVFQIFTFEPELTAVECFKRSFNLIKGHWFRTIILLGILWFFSIYIITIGVSVVFDYLDLTDKICTLFNYFTNTIPLDGINSHLVHFHQQIITPRMISETIFYSVLSAIVMGLTLPIRSISWSLWYMNLNNLLANKSNNSDKKNKKNNKRNKNEYEE
ncbi:MAG: hypothetical protein E7Z87_00065 [Cyanobacteria bacterium SIG26]|nr:hypothetical protein [Cyanobacteria bacterium SIG26]